VNDKKDDFYKNENVSDTTKLVMMALENNIKPGKVYTAKLELTGKPELPPSA